MPSHAETLTVAQAADALEVSERTVWRYLKAGRLLGETVGSPGSQRTLIDAAAIDRFRDERQGGRSGALCAERDRLASALALAEQERDALRKRVAVLQRAVVEPYRPGPVGRAIEGAVSMLTRARSLRTSF